MICNGMTIERDYMGAGTQLTTCWRHILTFKLVLVLRHSSKEWLNQMQLYVFPFTRIVLDLKSKFKLP